MKRTFYDGIPLEMRAVFKEVTNEITKAKINYRKKIEMKYSSGDLRVAW